MISVDQIKELRNLTGLSIAQCRQALEQSGGVLEKARELLKQAGVAVAEKKAGRTLGAGAIGSYIHSNGALGALVELDCETDFVAKNSDFRALGQDLAMHVSAFAPADAAELLTQPFIRDAALTVADVMRNSIQKFGEKIEIIRFARFQVGAAD